MSALTELSLHNAIRNLEIEQFILKVGKGCKMLANIRQREFEDNYTRFRFVYKVEEEMTDISWKIFDLDGKELYFDEGF